MRRLYKLLIIIIIAVISIVIIYYKFNDNKINYLIISDNINNDIKLINNYIYKQNINKINNYYSLRYYSINEINDDINKNIKINNKHIKNIIDNSNIITIYIGMQKYKDYSILNKTDLMFIDNFLLEYDNFFKEIRLINKRAKIYLIGVYENEYINKSEEIIINSGLKEICNLYGMNFIDISKVNKEEFNIYKIINETILD